MHYIDPQMENNNNRTSTNKDCAPVSSTIIEPTIPIDACPYRTIIIISTALSKVIVPFHQTEQE